MSEINEEKMQNVVEQMKEDNIKFIRLQFVDINGTVKNIVIPLVFIKSILLKKQGVPPPVDIILLFNFETFFIISKYSRSYTPSHGSSNPHFNSHSSVIGIGSTSHNLA